MNINERKTDQVRHHGKLLPVNLADKLGKIQVRHHPVLSNGQLYLSTTDGKILQWDAASLKQLQQLSIASKKIITTIDEGQIIPHGRHLISSYGNQLLIIDKDEMKIEKTWKSNKIVSLVNAFIDQDKIFLELNTDEYTDSVLINLSDFEIKWSIRNNLSSLFTCRHNDLMIMTSGERNEKILAVDFLSGKKAWEVDSTKHGLYTDIFSQQTQGTISGGRPLLQDQLLVVGVEGHTLLGIDCQNGNIQWELKVEDDNPACLCADNDIIYLAGYESFYRINATSGLLLNKIDVMEKWQSQEFTEIKGGAMIVGDSIVCIQTTGTVGMIDKKSGELVWTYDCNDVFHLGDRPEIINEKLWLKDFSGNQYIFEIST